MGGFSIQAVTREVLFKYMEFVESLGCFVYPNENTNTPVQKCLDMYIDLPQDLCIYKNNHLSYTFLQLKKSLFYPTHHEKHTFSRRKRHLNKPILVTSQDRFDFVESRLGTEGFKSIEFLSVVALFT